MFGAVVQIGEQKMKKLTRLLMLMIVAFGGLGVAKIATAEVSYNVGYVSEYYFRGILQKSSSASAGIDYEENGFYLGAWGADVGDGIEVDVYLGYGIETEAGFTASLGYTTYQYTGDTFDDEYNEGNLNLGYGIFGLEYSKGTCGCFGAESDYRYIFSNTWLSERDFGDLDYLIGSDEYGNGTSFFTSHYEQVRKAIHTQLTALSSAADIEALFLTMRDRIPDGDIVGIFSTLLATATCWSIYEWYLQDSELQVVTTNNYLFGYWFFDFEKA